MASYLKFEKMTLLHGPPHVKYMIRIGITLQHMTPQSWCMMWRRRETMNRNFHSSESDLDDNDIAIAAAAFRWWQMAILYKNLCSSLLICWCQEILPARKSELLCASILEKLQNASLSTCCKMFSSMPALVSEELLKELALWKTFCCPRMLIFLPQVEELKMKLSISDFVLKWSVNFLFSGQFSCVVDE